MRYFNDSEIEILAASDADRIVMKKANGPPITTTTKNFSSFVIDTSGIEPGRYYWQQNAGDRVVATGEIDIEQNLSTAPADYDPRFEEEKTIEAIDAMLAGRATQQQRDISIGDKKISYSTIDELRKWREFFVEKLRKKKGTRPPSRILYEFK